MDERAYSVLSIMLVHERRGLLRRSCLLPPMWKLWMVVEHPTGGAAGVVMKECDHDYMEAQGYGSERGNVECRTCGALWIRYSHSLAKSLATCCELLLREREAQ